MFEKDETLAIGGFGQLVTGWYVLVGENWDPVVIIGDG